MALAPSLIVLIVIVALVEAVLKAFALWKSARRGQMAWFVCVFVFNTAGILPAIYLFAFSRALKR